MDQIGFKRLAITSVLICALIMAVALVETVSGDEIQGGGIPAQKGVIPDVDTKGNYANTQLAPVTTPGIHKDLVNTFPITHSPEDSISELGMYLQDADNVSETSKVMTDSAKSGVIYGNWVLTFVTQKSTYEKTVNYQKTLVLNTLTPKKKVNVIPKPGFFVEKLYTGDTRWNPNILTHSAWRDGRALTFTFNSGKLQGVSTWVIVMKVIEPNGIYSPKKAKAYALAWWSNKGPIGPYKYYTRNCANFVSQCLIAGGMKLHGSSDSGYAYLTVNELHNFLISKGVPVVWSRGTSGIPSWLQQGDVVAFGYSTDRKKPTYNHIGIVVNGAGKSSLIAAQSSNCRNRPVTEFFSTFHSGVYHNL